MTARYRIPITAITVFGASSLLALSVGIVLYLGFNQAAESTRQLWADQGKTLIDAMELSLDERLKPIADQARWVARDIKDLTDLSSFDDYIYGSLAATPQVAGVAIIAANGNGRRWHREERVAITGDWSKNPWFQDYLNQVKAAASTAWREPIFTDTINSSTLLHDIPLHNADDEFIGIFAQIVTVHELSAFLARDHADTGVTPFVLYNREYVLAHPAIISGSEQQPLLHLDELGDLILKRIWSPDEEAAFISAALEDTQASGIFWGDNFYLYLYRDIERYGPAPWTIGVYLNTSLHSHGQIENLLRSLAAGLAVLVFAIIASIIVGRQVSRPIKEIVSAANTVDAGGLDDVEPMGGSYIRELDDASKAFNNMVHGLRERKVIRDTLGRFVPEKVASSLLAGGGAIPVQQTEATILFCDIESFTQLTETLGPVKIVDVLNAYFSAMVEILEQNGGVVTQFQGDAILATFNVPIADDNHAHNAVHAALEMLNRIASDKYEGEKLNIRIGINTGPVVAGAIGARGRLNYTVHGDAVNLAARLEALNKEYGTRLMISESSAASVNDVELSRVGEVTARGQTRSINIYTVEVPITNHQSSY
ncbi:MAG: HAMP domain-containing protein [Gammaproteobacteria bacterium]|nr:HAMP domain-containing protein [Gammaproteobacteria bacterium]MDH3857515.1 HAMP domain-containing protein [Gammaproteobacteria bacterium]